MRRPPYVPIVDRSDASVARAAAAPMVQFFRVAVASAEGRLRHPTVEHDEVEAFGLEIQSYPDGRPESWLDHSDDLDSPPPSELLRIVCRQSLILRRRTSVAEEAVEATGIVARPHGASVSRAADTCLIVRKAGCRRCSVCIE